MYILYNADQKRIHPIVSSIEKGNDGFFKCNSNIQTKWLHNNKKLPANVRVIDKFKLFIHIVEPANRGYYKCLGYTENSEQFFAVAVLQVLSKLIYKYVFFCCLHNDYYCDFSIIHPFLKRKTTFL